MWKYTDYEELYHHGIKGQRWGRRRWQNKDGSLTPAGEKRYGDGDSDSSSDSPKQLPAGKNTGKNDSNKQKNTYGPDDYDIVDAPSSSKNTSSGDKKQTFEDISDVYYKEQAKAEKESKAQEKAENKAWSYVDKAIRKNEREEEKEKTQVANDLVKTFREQEKEKKAQEKAEAKAEKYLEKAQAKDMRKAEKDLRKEEKERVKAEKEEAEIKSKEAYEESRVKAYRAAGAAGDESRHNPDVERDAFIASVSQDAAKGKITLDQSDKMIKDYTEQKKWAFKDWNELEKSRLEYDKKEAAKRVAEKNKQAEGGKKQEDKTTTKSDVEASKTDKSNPSKEINQPKKDSGGDKKYEVKDADGKVTGVKVVDKDGKYKEYKDVETTKERKAEAEAAAKKAAWEKTNKNISGAKNITGTAKTGFDAARGVTDAVSKYRQGKISKETRAELDTMSDKQLRDRINRIQMEQQYASLQPDKVQRGLNTASSVLSVMGSTAAVVSSGLGIALTIRKLLD